MTEVQLHHLSKQYDTHHQAVADLQLTLPSAQITALLGPSGCGKTTVLKMVAGLLEPSRGDITFNGESVLGTPAEQRGAVMVFQNHLLFPSMNVYDNIAFGLKMRGERKEVIRERVEGMLELVRLPGYGARHPHQLSGGQRQRVALARALVVAPRVLLLDEPLSNLDTHLRREMRDFIFGLQRQLQITTLVVTHDQEEAVILADRVALIFEGVLQQVGEAEDFYKRPLTLAIARFFGCANFIPGHKVGQKVVTPLGELNHGGSTLPDGPVVVTIRPESLQVKGEPEGNCVAGRVVNHIYAGTHTQLQVKVSADVTLEVVTHQGGQHDYEAGTPLYLHFPPPKIWLMPEKR